MLNLIYFSQKQFSLNSVVEINMLFIISYLIDFVTNEMLQ